LYCTESMLDVLFIYIYTLSLQFVRSRVGGARSGPSQCAVPLSNPDDKTLIFESRFESGNLAKVVKT